MLIDTHGHIGNLIRDRREFVDAANLIAKMDAWGIDRTCVLPVSEHPECGYLEGYTSDVLAACSRYPKRLIPFCLIDPRFGNDPAFDFSDLLGEYRALGCKGIGEVMPKMDMDDPRVINLFRQAGKFGMPVVIDMNTPYSYGFSDEYGLPRLERTLNACPGTVVVGHGPTFWAEISAEPPPRPTYPTGPVVKGGAVPRLMRRYPNLWADLSAGSGYTAITRDPAFGIEFLDEFQDKLLFGTDSCVRSDVDLVAPIVAFFRKLAEDRTLPAKTLEKMAWKNAVRLFGI